MERVRSARPSGSVSVGHACGHLLGISPYDEVWRMIDSNLGGALLMTPALLSSMVQRGRGNVVTVTDDRAQRV